MAWAILLTWGVLVAEKKSRFWGTVCAVAASPVTLAAGVAKGAYDAASGNGSFKDGFDKATDSVVEAAYEFGEEHGSTVTTGLVSGAALALGRRAVDGGSKHH